MAQARRRATIGNCYATVDEALGEAQKRADRSGSRVGVFTNMRVPGCFSCFYLTLDGHPGREPNDLVKGWPLHGVAEPIRSRWQSVMTWQKVL